MDLKLSAQEVEDLIFHGFGGGERRWLLVEALEPGLARVRLPFRPSMLRPGKVVSGPALFSAADTAMYAAVLAHVGPELMAVTTDFTIHFLSMAKPGDIRAQARLLKLGKRLAVLEVQLRTGDDPTLVAHVTGSYALPPRK